MGITVDIPAEARELIGVLEAAGHEAWVVGGAVRDAVLRAARAEDAASRADSGGAEAGGAEAPAPELSAPGVPGAAPALVSAPESPAPFESGDIDIACSAPAMETAAVARAAGFAVRETGLAHGTVTVVVRGRAFETTAYRVDGRYTDGRHPDSVAPARSIEEDLARRDFTMNALAWHPARGLRDPYGGAADIRAGIIRTVGDPAQRFREDALRILRAARFAAQLGFAVDSATCAQMERMKARLAALPVERIRQEMDKLLLGGWVHDALMACAGPVCVAVPALAACRGFEQHSAYHCFDVYEHTAWVVQNMPPVLSGRWAALLHDVGKPAAFTRRDGVGHFKGHAAISERIARDTLPGMCFSAADSARIARLVGLHDMHGIPSERGVKRMLMRLNGDVGLYRMLLALQRADALAHAPSHRERAQEADANEALLQRVLDEHQAFSRGDLAVDGADLMAAGVPAGPGMGRVLDELLEAVVEGTLPNTREALLAFVAGGQE